MAALQNYSFKASTELQAEMMVSAPGDFDFVCVKNEAGESRLDIVGESRQRMARFLQAYASRFARVIHIAEPDGQPGEELIGLSTDDLVNRLETIREMIVRKRGEDGTRLV